MAKANITEKTLELNICEEILVDIRDDYPKAFWYGPSTRSERKQGYDASLEGVEGHLLFLSIQAPAQVSSQLSQEITILREVYIISRRKCFDRPLTWDRTGTRQLLLGRYARAAATRAENWLARSLN